MMLLPMQRKAAKEAKVSQQLVAANPNPNQEKSLSVSLALEAHVATAERINATPQKYQHGLLSLLYTDQKVCLEFISAFIAVFMQGEHTVAVESFIAARHATAEKHADVYILPR